MRDTLAYQESFPHTIDAIVDDIPQNRKSSIRAGGLNVLMQEKGEDILICRSKIYDVCAKCAGVALWVMLSPVAFGGENDLVNATASGVGIVRTRELDRSKSPNWALSLSPDQKNVVHAMTDNCIDLLHPGCRHYVVVRDLATGRLVEKHQVDYRAEATAYSSDGKYLAYCYSSPKFMGGNPVVIIDRNTRKQTEIVTLPVCDGHEGVWGDPQDLVFLPIISTGYGSFAVNLDTLAVGEADESLESSWSNPEERSVNKNIFIHASQGENGDIIVSNRDKSFSRWLDYVEGYSRCLVTRDLKFVVIGSAHLGPTEESYRLQVHDIGYKAESRMEYSLAFGGPVQVTEEELRDIEAAVLRGERFVGRIHAPKINPLNGKTIGYDAEIFKGEAVLLKNGAVRVVYEAGDIKPGDVITLGDQLPIRKLEFAYIDIWGVLGDNVPPK